MTFIVTGGAGFIGSNLCEKLVELGKEVVVLDNLHTGTTENLHKISNKIKFQNLASEDISELEIENVEGIYHFGMPSSSPMYKDDHSLFASALNSAIAVFDFAVEKKCKVVYASTSSLYNGLEPPHKEDMQLIPKDYYSEVRIQMERLSKMYYSMYGLETVGMRFFSVYGKNEKAKQKFANIVTQFLWEMKANQTPIIFGDGSQTRDFTYVSDVVDACILAFEKGKAGESYNVGNGMQTSFTKVVEILNKVLGKSIEPKYQENKILNYVDKTLADTSKSQRDLGFKAKIGIEEGISKLVEFY